ncbi:MAG: SpoVR family protein [Gammaproteobacteria bacterium]|nr:SpoVR family protein [Gammaproteobacteria bacterium]
MEPLDTYLPRIEELSRELGLDYFPVDFEVVPPSFMMEVAVYGLPVRMPHWSFGMRYIYQLVQHRMGHSRIFEVVFPGNPGRAYLANNNSTQENTLVVCHVLGHADFAKNNTLFGRCQEQVGYRVVELAAAHAHRMAEAIEKHGQQRVERVLDAALALEHQIDVDQCLTRPPYAAREVPKEEATEPKGEFQARYNRLADQQTPVTKRPQPHADVRLPPRPEHDLLWFIARYAPEMEDWERDIFFAVREESFYFYPVFACNIMNEGWASYWHARLLREADWLPQSLYVDALKAHSDVVRPVAGEGQVALNINPYHLGFSMWERIVERDGMDAARRIMREEDDFGFVRNYLDDSLAEELGLFGYSALRNGQVEVVERDIHELQETVLAPRFNFGAPRVAVSEVRNDGTLVLRHDYNTDGKGLDTDRARKVAEYIHAVWRRPVVVHTTDSRDAETVIRVGS